MSKLSEAKSLGGIGSILMILFLVPAFGWVLSIVGAILVLIAIKYIAVSVSDPSIFNNMLIAVLVGLIGVVVGVFVIFAAVLRAVGLNFLRPSLSRSPPNIAPGDFVGLIVGVIAGLVVLWILLLVSAYFVRKSYSKMSTKLGVGMFSTAGLLYLIGAALTIIFVGFIIIFVALILNIVAFFSIPDHPQMAQPVAPMPPPAPVSPAS